MNSCSPKLKKVAASGRKVETLEGADERLGTSREVRLSRCPKCKEFVQVGDCPDDDSLCVQEKIYRRGFHQGSESLVNDLQQLGNTLPEGIAEYRRRLYDWRFSVDTTICSRCQRDWPPRITMNSKAR